MEYFYFYLIKLYELLQFAEISFLPSLTRDTGKRYYLERGQIPVLYQNVFGTKIYSLSKTTRIKHLQKTPYFQKKFDILLQRVSS